jgi:hypothetical protein
MPGLGASKRPTAQEGRHVMNRTARRPVVEDEAVAPVTILDGLGRTIRIVPAEEFRRIHGIPERPTIDQLRRSRGRVKPHPPEPRADADDS